jgi:hypothetical protein
MKVLPGIKEVTLHAKAHGGKPRSMKSLRAHVEHEGDIGGHYPR